MSDAPLHIILWPNPTYRNRADQGKWFFSVALRETRGSRVQVQRYRAEWITEDGQVFDRLENRLDLSLPPFEQVNFSELWVSSPLNRFRYRLTLFGTDAQGQAFVVQGELSCR
ncbi:MAG: hypothetical protein D6736_02880 [Nitrospinota bacterium]|nr:MAG: hypothetical protein D6736_02880 [Nitrospinota bacterium]